MGSILYKELKLSTSIITYLFIVFGFLFFFPGYPVLCGVFFVTLGIFKNYQINREANDFVFSALLPVAKKDVVKGKFLSTCLIEMGGFVIMVIVTLLRMTAFVDAEIYRQNALMNANFFALGMALVVFGLFNLIFVGGFFRTAYKYGVPFLIYIVATFAVMGIAEYLHYIPGMELLNAFGFDHFGLQFALFGAGALTYILITLIAYRVSCRRFEKIDL